MKTKFHSFFVAVALLALPTLNSQLSTVFAQGSLTPPGAPAPTMLTLNQIEPRIPISSTPFVITNPGSYYLTTNLNVTTGTAITISNNDVTLDLNGFTISSTDPANSGTGVILAGNISDITIFNGHIKGEVTNNNSGVFGGSGFANGISCIASTPQNVRVANVSVSGCEFEGIFLSIGNSTFVESCTVRTVGEVGIYADRVSHSGAYQTGSSAIFANVVSECIGSCIDADYGVYAQQTADNCYGTTTGIGYGLFAGDAINCSGVCTGDGVGLVAGEANNCYGQDDDNGDGMDADIAIGCYGESSGSGDGLESIGDIDNNIAVGCYGESGSGTGLYAYLANLCYGQSGSGTGLGAYIANSCYGSTESVTHKYNML
jgi:hypothetical protein